MFPNVTIEDVKLAHIADQAVQDKYGVTYHQFWVNESAGTVFCLMEGPDKESCAKVHKEAHGNVACELIEVERGFYELFMGDAQRVDHGLVLHADGSVDKGYRFIAVVNIIGNTKITSSKAYKSLLFPIPAKENVRNCIAEQHGREVSNLGEDSIIATFIHADDALRFALKIHHKLSSYNRPQKNAKWDISFTIGISGGQPLSESTSLFESAIRDAHRLSMIAQNKEIVVGNLLLKLTGQKSLLSEKQIRIVHKNEEKFLSDFFTHAEKVYRGESLGVAELSRLIGISRPQLYRKINSLTGRSPISFLRDLRLKKALSMLIDKNCNISEVAYELGYSNPSYFSKCFTNKYGIRPSKFVNRTGELSSLQMNQ